MNNPWFEKLHPSNMIQYDFQEYIDFAKEIQQKSIGLNKKWAEKKVEKNTVKDFRKENQKK